MGEIVQGDCLEKLKKMSDNSIDSCVTDPPYGWSFMGKSWDYDIPTVELWQEVLRVLKPGGHALVACGTKTQHRMAVNLEDAGFEIRDLIAWVYGSGFPKSQNIGKAIDKKLGNERETLPPHQFPDGSKQRKTARAGIYSDQKRQAENTKGNTKWEGWGSALKPSIELWTLVRKPLNEKTIADNVLRWGTGGLAIDECRLETKPRLTGTRGEGEEIKANPTSYKGSGSRDLQTNYDKKMKNNPQGRFPANLIHSGEKEVTDMFPKANQGHWSKTKTQGFGKFGGGKSEYKGVGRKDNTDKSASRFFKQCEPDRLIYCPKASKKERNFGLDEEKYQQTGRWNSGGEFQEVTKKGNYHSTVKPVTLMRYLTRLITPKEGTCLDPFAGSGSTGVACKLEGFNFIGIEKEEEYCEIARTRINAWQPDNKLPL